MVRPFVLVALLATLAFAPPVHAGQAEATYDVPGSVVVRGVFGVGRLLCADPLTAPLHDLVRNGACFDYGGNEGADFVMEALDAWWSDTSVTIAVDVNGDGCISESCNGVPNTANDYRLSNCGPVAGTLPQVDSGVDPIIQVFLRGIDVTEDLAVCGATNGNVVFSWF